MDTDRDVDANVDMDVDVDSGLWMVDGGLGPVGRAVGSGREI
jgi:hypothetical protein